MNISKKFAPSGNGSQKSSLKRSEAVHVTRGSESNRDTVALARSGKQQVLKWISAGLAQVRTAPIQAYDLVARWYLADSLLRHSGGPAGLLYAFLIAWVGNLSVWIVMGELSSMVPTAGGQYHWVSLMAPRKVRRLLSYVTGWLTVSGWVVGTAAGVFFASSLIQALLILNLPDYDASGWQGTLIYLGVLLICFLMNTVLGRALPVIEVGILIVHVLGFFAILIPMVYLTPSYPASYVFTTFQNLGGWQTQALSFFIGMNASVAGFIGTDGAIHMSEEVRNAEMNVPRSMILSIIINGALAFGTLLMLLFYAGSLEDAINNAPNGYPFIAIFANGVGSKAGATGMTAVVVLLEICSSMGALAAASRMMWAFARDRGLPGHRQLRKVDRRTTIPILAVLTVCLFDALIGLINIGSSMVLNVVISLTLEAFYSSYLLACGMLLYRRIRGHIKEPVDGNTTEDEQLQWGPWRLKGWLGIANNVFACAYLILATFFSFWPSSIRPTPSTMNYSSAVLGAVAIGSITYYVISAKKTYVGPVAELKVQNLQDA